MAVEKKGNWNPYHRIDEALSTKDSNYSNEEVRGPGFLAESQVNGCLVDSDTKLSTKTNNPQPGASYSLPGFRDSFGGRVTGPESRVLP